MAKTSTSFSKERPGKGRIKGSKNKKTLELAEVIEMLISRPEYMAKLAQRVDRGKASHIELFLWHHRYGKPKERHELTGADGAPLVVQWMRDADDD